MADYVKATDKHRKHQSNEGLIGIGTMAELKPIIADYLEESGADASDVEYTIPTTAEIETELHNGGLI